MTNIGLLPIVWSYKMDDTFTRFFNDVFARLDGPLHFRFVLQPAMAIFFAIRDGLRDARQGRPAYFWSLFTEPGLRRDLLRDGWRSISKVSRDGRDKPREDVVLKKVTIERT